MNITNSRLKINIKNHLKQKYLDTIMKWVKISKTKPY